MTEPMTNTELTQQAYTAIDSAQKIMAIIWKRGQSQTSELAMLNKELGLANAASQELLNRALGNPPAKVGP